MLAILKVPKLPLVIHPHLRLHRRIKPVPTPQRQTAADLSFHGPLADASSQIGGNDNRPDAFQFDKFQTGGVLLVRPMTLVRVREGFKAFYDGNRCCLIA